MNTFFYYIKKNFPSLYTYIRGLLFPIVNYFRTRKSSRFSSPLKKRVAVLGFMYDININPSNGFIDTQIFTTGQYELDILSVIKENLRSGDTFVDIGGNIGWHTLFAAQVVGTTGHVYTFEPIKKLVTQLNQNIADNQLSKRVTIFPFGCSDTESEVALHINPINIGGSSVFSLGAKSTQTETITLKPADSVLDDISTKIALIKIDTEGSELEALIGLTQTLETHQPKLIIEYSPSFWGNQAFEKSVAFFTLLTTHNYRIFDLEQGHQEITPTEEWIRDFKKLQTNFLCLPTSFESKL